MGTTRNKNRWAQICTLSELFLDAYQVSPGKLFFLVKFKGKKMWWSKSNKLNKNVLTSEEKKKQKYFLCWKQSLVPSCGDKGKCLCHLAESKNQERPSLYWIVPPSFLMLALTCCWKQVRRRPGWVSRSQEIYDPSTLYGYVKCQYT